MAAADGTRKGACILSEYLMAPPKTKTRPRSSGSGSARTGSKTTLRRPPPKRGAGISNFVLPLSVLGIFVVIAVALIVLYRVSSNTGGAPSGDTVANVRCDAGEQLATHYHTHLTILYQGQQVTVPGQIGIQSTCLYWMHTHDDSGIIHVEAPKSEANRKFKLGEFFTVWGQPLTSKQVSTIKVGPREQVKAWVNGKPYTGDPANITLASKEQIVIEIGPPFVDNPPPAYTWDEKNYPQ
jgi:hypothetical protein